MLAEDTSAACRGFSRPWEAETFSSLVPADGEGNKEQSLFPTYRSGVPGATRVSYTSSTPFFCGKSTWVHQPEGEKGHPCCSDGHITPLPELPMLMHRNNPPLTSKQFVKWRLFKRWRPRRKPILETLPEPVLRSGPCKSSQLVQLLTVFSVELSFFLN